VEYSSFGVLKQVMWWHAATRQAVIAKNKHCITLQRRLALRQQRLSGGVLDPPAGKLRPYRTHTH
jgi:hypothetical protein